MKKFFAALAALAIFAIQPVHADEMRLAQLEELRKQIPNRFPQREFELPNPVRGIVGGSNYWISPVMTNSPGTISGEPYTIDRKRLSYVFGLSVVNPSSETIANVQIECLSEDGERLARYSTAFQLNPLGGAQWDSTGVTPPATDDRVTVDADNVWCLVAADRPVMAFGWSERRFGGDVDRSQINLEPASR